MHLSNQATMSVALQCCRVVLTVLIGDMLNNPHMGMQTSRLLQEERFAQNVFASMRKTAIPQRSVFIFIDRQNKYIQRARQPGGHPLQDSLYTVVARPTAAEVPCTCWLSPYVLEQRSHS
jgi:hypothetical protein